MQITALGPLAIDGRAVEGARLPALLLPLIHARGRIVPAGQLVEAVWEGAPPADPSGALQALVTRARRLGLTIVATGGGYRLDPQGLDVDLLQAQDSLVRARAAASARDHARAATTAAQGLALWPPDGAAHAVGPAGHLYRDLVEVQVEAGLAPGGHLAAEAVDHLRDAVRHLPTDEPLTALLMRALAAHGRDAEALAVYERLRRDLQETYGTDPSPVVARTHVALLRGELSRAQDDEAPDPAGPPVPDGSAGPASPAGHPGATTAVSVATAPAVWRRPSTPLVGRTTDVVELERELARHTLVTLVAVGGAGKTRLAVEVAARASGRGEPVHAVELAGVRDPAEVLPALLSALGAAESTPEVSEIGARRVLGPQERMLRAVASLQGLLVVDNCEHLLDAAADVVAQVLGAAGPGLRVLTTSRAPLGIVGEAVHPVATLGDDAALSLLECRGRAARPGLAWDQETARELCHRLDNLPLAIELAAARLRSMPLADVLTGVAHRFALLDGALRGLPDRHHGLWAMVDWSWALLDPLHRTLLRDLAVIPAPFTADTAAAVAGLASTEAARDGLTTLVEQSLLILEETEDGRPARYRMLETVREYGEAHLADDGARDAAMARLIGWAARRVRALRESYIGPDQLTALRATADDHDTLVASLRWAIEHDADAEAFAIAAGLLAMWTMHGLHLEVAVWGRLVVHADDRAARRATWRRLASPGAPGTASAGALDPDDVAIVSALTMLTAGITHDLRSAALARRLARWASTLGASTGRISHRSGMMARVAMTLTPFTDPRHAQAVEELLAEDDAYLHGLGLFLRGALRENDGDLAGSAADARDAYAFFESIGDHWGMGMAAQGVGQWLQGDSARSDEWMTRAIDHMSLLGAVSDAGALLVRRDLRRALEGSAEAAAALEAVLVSPSASDQERAQAAIGLAVLAASREEWPVALAHSDLAVRTARADALSVPQSRIMVEVSAAVVRIRAGLDGAGLLAVAASSAFAVSDMPVLGAVAQGYAELADSRGDHDRAAELRALGGRLGADLGLLVDAPSHRHHKELVVRPLPISAAEAVTRIATLIDTL